MNTKEFIELLQKHDPDGTAEVVFQNRPILWASLEPGYYDGCFYKVLEDKSPAEVKIKVCGKEKKLSIWTHENLYDFVFDTPRVEIYYDSDYAWQSHKERLEKMRLEGIEAEMEIRKELGK